MSIPKRTSIALKLPQLQNLIKRDPIAYKDEFEQQRRHFDSELEIFKLRPTADSERFTDLVTFMSQVCSSYKEETSAIPTALMSLLETNGSQVHPDVRSKLLGACIHLRNKEMIEPLVLLKLSFRLLSIPDRGLRSSLGEYIFNDIKGINANKHNDKLNKRIQALLFALVEEDTGIIAKKSVGLLTDLYRRRVWTDARTVNVLATACCSTSIQVAVPAINFFLGIDAQMMDDEDEENKKVVQKGEFQDPHSHSKKTKKRLRQTEKAKEALAKVARAQDVKAAVAVPVFPAIQLIHDPQTLAEKLLVRSRSSGERFEVKLLLMNFVSRLIGCHKLLLLNFYSFLQRYLTSHQTDVTRILAYLVQGCHDLVPPEDLVPVVKTIAHNFITERCTNEQIAVGLNSVREIIGRVPSMLREDGMGDFIQDLAMYGRKQHKSVMIAAHGVINLVRQVYPSLLKTKDRGKFHNIESIPSAYGVSQVSSGVDGAELLQQLEEGDIIINSDDEIVWKEDMSEDGDFGDNQHEWEEEEEEEDGDDAPDLVPVDSDGNAVESDSDDEEEDWQEVASGDDSDNEEEEEEDSGDWVEVKSEEENNSDSNNSDDEEEEEEEGEWEMMSDDDENANQDTTTGKRKAEVAISLAKRARVDATRVLTDKDFELIRKLKEAQAERSRDPKYRSKRAIAAREHNAAATADDGARTGNSAATNFMPGEDSDADENVGSSYAFNPDSLVGGNRFGKTSKIDRIATVVAGRKDEKWEQGGHRGGLTNLEKERTKNYVMVRKGKASVRSKVNKSNSNVRYEAMHRKEQFGREKRKRRRTQVAK